MTEGAVRKVVVQFPLPWVLRVVDSIEPDSLPPGYDPVTGVGLDSLVPPELDSVLRSRLSAGEVPSEQTTLLHDVAAVFVSQDFWTAALLIEVFFEARIAVLFRDVLSKKGMTGAQIDAQFVGSNGQPINSANL